MYPPRAMRAGDHPQRAGVTSERVEVEVHLDVQRIRGRAVGIHVPQDIAIEEVAVALRGHLVVVAEDRSGDRVDTRIGASSHWSLSLLSMKAGMIQRVSRS